jgi:C4-dicarboxylate-specific signal transduction histidine kinase
VFSPFCTTKPRGIGVGLSVARRTLIDHGGTIAVPACNAGCRVDVTLPIA